MKTGTVKFACENKVMDDDLKDNEAKSDSSVVRKNVNRILTKGDENSSSSYHSGRRRDKKLSIRVKFNAFIEKWIPINEVRSFYKTSKYTETLFFGCENLKVNYK